MMNDVTRHHVLTDGGDGREGDVDATGDQHHKQATGQNTENGVTGGDIGQVAKRHKFTGADTQANHQQQNQ
ncbi:hypothetical protein SRABI106_03279 [Rahnella aquatilis]|nr:hypothetical protein SRABI106_03279 [Rahnella aquatilis]